MCVCVCGTHGERLKLTKIDTKKWYTLLYHAYKYTQKYRLTCTHIETERERERERGLEVTAVIEVSLEDDSGGQQT